MADMKASIQSMFDASQCNKDGRMPKGELEQICLSVGLRKAEIDLMFKEIDKDSDTLSVTALIDWIFADGASETKDEKSQAAPAVDEDLEEEEEDDDADVVDELPPPPKKVGPRSSVSAEAYGAWNTKQEFAPPRYEKTDEQRKRIEHVLSGSFLFQAIEEKDMKLLIDAVQEWKVQAKTRVIQKGDDGDFMCIIECGTFECLAVIGGEEKCVKTCQSGDSFGELALMYNCPRAASVESTTEGTVWKLDRETFNHIVADAAQKKRQKHEEFLKKVPLLEKMDNYERSQVADALKEQTFVDGATIVTEGEEGNKFYIVSEGSAVATKKDIADPVMNYKVGDYFGELALINNQPRKATITSKGCKVLSLDRKSFKRLLGSVDELGTRTYT